MNITNKISTLLADQTNDYLVNFNRISKLTVITNNTRAKLLSRGGLEDVKTNLINLANGDEASVLRKQDGIYYVDPRLAIAFIKKHCPDLSEKIVDWELEYGRGDIPEKLCEKAPALLQHLMSVFDNSKFRCTYQEGEWLFCLHDVIQAATGDQKNNSRNLGRALELDPSLINPDPRTHKFYRSSAMQVVDINTSARFWMVLPGARAARFRSGFAKLFICVLGGSQKLAQEIIHIGEFYDKLPKSHPLNCIKRNVRELEDHYAAQDNSTESFIQTVIKPPVIKQKPAQGYLYCLSGDGMNIMKIGHWRGTINSLEARYQTYYGKSLRIHTRQMLDCRSAEQKALLHFGKSTFGGEIYPISQWIEVIQFIDNLLDLPCNMPLKRHFDTIIQ